ncbi:MAG: hypothetical protein WCE45_11180 [Sedimentisphaerales bacterium]
MDTKFFDSLFGGDSANGIKLCMGLTEGDFWARPAGVQLLYQGQDDNIDFDKITAASEIDEGVLEISSGQPLTQWLYVARRVNCSGYEEKTLGAAVRVEFDSLGGLIERSCNKVFIIAAKQVDGDRILLKWFYQPIHQAKKINRFKIYSDNSTGTIDYQNPIGSVNYIGRKFYQFITGRLSGDSYKFCIRAAAEDNSEDGFTGQIKIGLNKQSPDGISILQSSVI